jgi:hypothetical protein
MTHFFNSEAVQPHLSLTWVVLAALFAVSLSYAFFRHACKIAAEKLHAFRAFKWKKWQRKGVKGMCF